MIKRILAWCVILAAVSVFLWMIAYALTTPNGRITLTVIAAIIVGCVVGAVLIWAIEEVTGW